MINSVVSTLTTFTPTISFVTFTPAISVGWPKTAN